jgi:hypothetical protein
MHDKRVFRGSVFNHKSSELKAPFELKKGKGASKHSKNQTNSPPTSPQYRPITPAPVDGRMHMDIQTDNYLEELSDRFVEKDISTQTDALTDLHPAPLFVPMSSGLDTSTQIDNGDLFDFDLEVQPILDVLIGKTLEISVLEVMEEYELEQIQARRETFEQVRNAEVAEVQRLEAEAKRKHGEKQRRIDEQQKRLKAQAEMEKRLAAQASSKQYLSSLHSKVFSSLVESGHFADPVHDVVRTTFLPSLLQEAASQASQLDLARQLLDTILRQCIRTT